jgi:hypothetical protein
VSVSVKRKVTSPMRNGRCRLRSGVVSCGARPGSCTLNSRSRPRSGPRLPRPLHLPRRALERPAGPPRRRRRP